MISVEKVYRRFFNLWKYTGHIALSYDSKSRRVTSVESTLLKTRFQVNAVLSFYFVFFYLWQTLRCKVIYEDGVMYLVALSWFCGYSQGVFGHHLNQLMHCRGRWVCLNRLLQMEENIFYEYPVCQERHGKSCNFVFNIYYFMWVNSILGQWNHYTSQPNFYAYLYSYKWAPTSEPPKVTDDPWGILLFSLHENYAMFLDYGHIVLADMMTHMVCDFVAQTLVSMTKNFARLKESSKIERVFQHYRELKLLMLDINQNFGKMTFAVAIINVLQTSLDLYGVIRLMKYLPFQSGMLFWSNATFRICRYILGWKCMANVKERSNDFLIHWKGQVNSPRFRKERKVNLRILKSLSRIEYKVGWNFFAMSNFALMNLIFLTTSNIIFFLKANDDVV